MATACPDNGDGGGSDDTEPDDVATDDQAAEDPDPGSSDQDEPVEEPDQDEPAGEEPVEAEPADLSVELDLGDAYLEDDLLETTATMSLDPVSGLVSIAAGPEVRDEGWHGVTLFLTAPSGLEGELQCSYRPDIAASDETYTPACNAFALPNFEPCGSHPFTDAGVGEMIIEGPFHFADGAIVFRPEGVIETCDLAEAALSGGFIGTCDASFSCRSTLLSEEQLLETVGSWPGA